jgi:RHS repeat-associated protein
LSFTYDPWGNFLQQALTSSWAYQHQYTAASNNQLVGYSYDAAGNMTHDLSNGGVNYTYDQENRITDAAGYTYIYDADGDRVEKSNGSTGTLYWYMTPGIVGESDLAGNLKTEYVFFDGERVARRDLPAGTVSYYFSDHLKTASVVTDATGTILDESDYYPWGGELQFINNLDNHYKFTGKERDSESGLDLMGARYYSSALGRFVQTDPLYIEAHRLADPQLLNLYVYARNNPLRFTDSTGMDIYVDCHAQLYDCDHTVADLNNRKGAQFKVELGKDSKLHVVKGSVGKNLSKAEKALIGAINDTKNHATINVSGDTGQAEFGTHDSRGVNSVDLGNLSKLDAPSNAGGLNSGDALAHEVLDAYYSLSMGEAAADRAAAALYPGLYGPTENHNNLNPSGSAVTSSTYYQGISDGRGGERVSIRFITPIPGIDADPRFNSLERRNEAAHDAGSRVTGVTFEPKQ